MSTSLNKEANLREVVELLERNLRNREAEIRDLQARVQSLEEIVGT